MLPRSAPRRSSTVRRASARERRRSSLTRGSRTSTRSSPRPTPRSATRGSAASSSRPTRRGSGSCDRSSCPPPTPWARSRSSGRASPAPAVSMRMVKASSSGSGRSTGCGPPSAPRRAAWRPARSRRRWPTPAPGTSSASRSPSSSSFRRNWPAWRPISPPRGCSCMARRARGSPGRPVVSLGARVADLRRDHRNPAPDHRRTAREGPPGVKIVAIGGGPAALYFAILMKKADPAHEITVLERNRLDDTFGFGVVFSDATQNNLAAADPQTYDEMASHFAHWDDIDVHYRGQVIRSSGHGFSGLSRRGLLAVLGRRCQELGVCLEVGTDVKDPAVYSGADLALGADGFNSTVRQRYAEHFQPSMDERPNRFVWLGTTRPFPAFTFYFKRDQHGLD